MRVSSADPNTEYPENLDELHTFLNTCCEECWAEQVEYKGINFFFKAEHAKATAYFSESDIGEEALDEIVNLLKEEVAYEYGPVKIEYEDV